MWRHRTQKSETDISLSNIAWKKEIKRGIVSLSYTFESEIALSGIEQAVQKELAKISFSSERPRASVMRIENKLIIEGLPLTDVLETLSAQGRRSGQAM